MRKCCWGKGMKIVLALSGLTSFRGGIHLNFRGAFFMRLEKVLS